MCLCVSKKSVNYMVKHPKILQIFKKIKTNSPFPVAACAIKQSVTKAGFYPVSCITYKIITKLFNILLRGRNKMNHKK
jgi:hypothetical protein